MLIIPVEDSAVSDSNFPVPVEVIQETAVHFAPLHSMPFEIVKNLRVVDSSQPADSSQPEDSSQPADSSQLEDSSQPADSSSFEKNLQVVEVEGLKFSPPPLKD